MAAGRNFEQRDTGAVHSVEPIVIALARSKLWANALEALEDVGLRYCLLRGPAAGAPRARHQEVDLLVDARDLERFGSTVSGFGFVPLAAWGYGGHHFYVNYEEHSGEWLKLDVVTSLGYGGRSGPLVSRALAGCLDRRRRASGRSLPELADALLGLILHCLLDKEAFREEHRHELERLRALVQADDTVNEAAAERFEAAFGRALTWSQATATIERGNWEWFLARRRRIAWELFRREPTGSAFRWLRGEFMRFVRPVLVACLRRGFSVALVGPEGAGKTTLAQALAEDVQIRARIVYMGSRTTPANQLIEQAYRSLVALARGLRGRFVVFDRHPYEHLTAEPAEGWGAKLWRKLLQMTCVSPGLIFVLDAPPEMLRSRRSGHSVDRLERERARYRALSIAGRNTIVIDASSDKEETIRRVTFLIWSRYRQHVAKTR